MLGRGHNYTVLTIMVAGEDTDNSRSGDNYIALDKQSI